MVFSISHTPDICQGRPEVQLLKDSHVVLVWETLAACRNVEPTKAVPCYAYNEQKQLFDLGDLVGINYHIPIVNSKCKMIPVRLFLESFRNHIIRKIIAVSYEKQLLP